MMSLDECMRARITHAPLILPWLDDFATTASFSVLHKDIFENFYRDRERVTETIYAPFGH